MRALAWVGCLTWIVGVAGCSNSSMVVKGQYDKLQQQQLATSRQNQELQNRAGALDRNNQELETLLAQSGQREKVLEDQLVVVRQQLQGVTTQVAQLREGKEASDKQAQALTASLRQHGGVSINPNNSFLKTLPKIPGVEVRRDGDVIRIELPESHIFSPGTSQLTQQGSQFISQVAGELTLAYPNNMIGIEGHTNIDRTPSPWRNPGHLSTARALVVYETLLSQAGLRPSQLFVVGHGSNHPVYSNATEAGKQRNSRVELVVYPDNAR